MTEDNHNQGSAAATQSRIRRLVTLPPLPRRSHELLQLLFDPDLDMLRLVELIEQTPPLAARMLGVANSAFFRTQVPVKHIPDAIIRILGLDLVRDLSVSFVLNQPFDLKACWRFDPIRFWVNAMESAVLTQLLATDLPLRNPPTPSMAYLGGLLHNLGLLALVHVSPETMNNVFSELECDPALVLSDVEQRHLGVDHTMAGAELASTWRLPAVLAAAMGPVDAPGGSDELTTLLSLVTLCSSLGRILRAGDRIEHNPELGRILAALDVRFDTWPALINRWRERSQDIEWLAISFAGARQ